MKAPTLFLAILALPGAMAQSTLPLIHATAKKVSIKDDGFLDKDAWNLSPKARPDIYTADRSRKTKYVTFYTDVDSIRVKLKPGGKVDFIILLNGTDSCYTEVASSFHKSPPAPESHDTIPFT